MIIYNKNILLWISWNLKKFACYIYIEKNCSEWWLIIYLKKNHYHLKKIIIIKHIINNSCIIQNNNLNKINYNLVDYLCGLKITIKITIGLGTVLNNNGYCIKDWCY